MTLLGIVVATILVFASSAFAQMMDPDLVGTWSTKSRAVLTGPGFYDPVNEKFFEPNVTGISYSFTSDGFYEEAYYRAISNPTNPSCPKGLMQFQHGRYNLFPNGSLWLEPFAVDGRQLTSDPCSYKTSLYVRYNQTEFFKSYNVGIDPYHKVNRLNLFKFDGSPMNPMYLVYRPPNMLPTMTMNPTAGPQATKGAKVKRDIGVPFNAQLMQKTNQIDLDRWWWIGVFMTGLGAVGYFCF